MNYIVNASTNVGIARENNQDSVIAQLAKNGRHSFLLAAVCDGMGGLSGGEIASATVVFALKSWFHKQCNSITKDTTINALSESCSAMLAELNEHLKAYEIQHRSLMGTTMSCFVALDEAYTIIHIGDSRIYRIAKNLTQLTTDHTIVAEAVAAGLMTAEEAAVSNERNKLSQCMGASKRYDPEVLFGTAKKGDVFLICSDGFRHRLSEEELHKGFQGKALKDDSSIRKVCENAIACVMERKEKDNISVAVIKAN